MEREKIKKALEEKAKSDSDFGLLLEYVRSIENELAAEKRRIKRMRLDFETVIEVVSQINARSLDTDLIENFTLSTLMGQFAVQRAFIMRQDDRMSGKIRTTESKNIRVPRMEFRTDGALAKALLQIEEPFRLEDKKELTRYSVFKQIAEMDVELCVPLIKRHENGEKELKGIICLGRKFNRMEFSGRDKEFLSLLGAMVAISLHNAQLYHRSIYDEMTQVFSRGHFDAHLFQEIERARRYHTNEETPPYKISLIMFDIDDFKHFNDKYGHQVGDAVLKGVAKTVKKTVRSSDIVARYGGEEFCIVLPETSKENALRAAERIRKAIEGFSLKTEEFGELSITVSMGVATYPEDADGVQELVREADKALYAAKEGGKNQVVAAGEAKR